MSKQIDAMRKLGLNDAEIAEVLEADKRIDKGEKLFELTAEQEKASKQVRKVDREVGVQKRQPKERKADDDKRFLIDAFVWVLTTDIEQCGDNVCAENVNIINPEREIEFVYNGRKFKIVLSAPRS